MDSQTNTASVPSSVRDMKKRKVFLLALIVCAVLVVGWFLVKHYMPGGSSVYKERAVIIDQIAAESTQYGETTNVIKGSTLNQIQKESSVPSQKKATPETITTPEQKQAVIDALVILSAQ